MSITIEALSDWFKDNGWEPSNNRNKTNKQFWKTDAGRVFEIRITFYAEFLEIIRYSTTSSVHNRHKSHQNRQFYAHVQYSDPALFKIIEEQELILSEIKMKKPMSPRAVTLLFLLFAIIALGCFVVFKYNVDKSRHLKASVYSDIDRVTTEVTTTEEGNLTMALFQREDKKDSFIVIYTKSGIVVHKIIFTKDGKIAKETTRIDAE